jgi:hypothetical protein
LADGDIGQAAGLEHGDSDEAKGNHVYEEFLMKGSGRVAMPRGDTEGVLEIAIESFDIPAPVIEVGQF